jgi:hypothetical protein
MLKDFNINLERLIIGPNCWRGVNSDQEGIWAISFFDPKSELKMGEIRQCVVKNVSLTRSDDIITVGFKIVHPLKHPEQELIEKATISEVRLEFDHDLQVFEENAENAENVENDSESDSEADGLDLDAPPILG